MYDTDREEEIKSKIRRNLKWKRQGEMGCSLCICKDVTVGQKKKEEE
jgi:hypothetical protein